MCGACCRVELKISNTSTRYRRFLRQIGYNVLPPLEPEQADCCDKQHDVTLDMGYCKHLLVKTDGGMECKCKIYGQAEFPQLCADFNCVGWAKAHETYSEKNGLLVAAQMALNRLRQKKIQNYPS
jgi:hypothetical protein